MVCHEFMDGGEWNNAGEISCDEAFRMEQIFFQDTRHFQSVLSVSAVAA